MTHLPDQDPKEEKKQSEIDLKSDKDLPLSQRSYIKELNCKWDFSKEGTCFVMPLPNKNKGK